MCGPEARPILLAIFALALFALTLRGQQTPGPLESQARELIQEGKLPEAEVKLLEAEKAEPSSYQVQRLLGIVYERQGKYPQDRRVTMVSLILDLVVCHSH